MTYNLLTLIAKVMLNRKEMGIYWASPFRIEIEDTLKQGENPLEIYVANFWHNPLVHDTNLSLYRSLTQIIVQANWESGLLKLLGPISI